MVGTEFGIGAPRLEVIEGVLNVWDEFVLHVEGECDVDGGEGGNYVVF